MFGKLKDKLKSWASTLSKDAKEKKEEIVEEILEEPKKEKKFLKKKEEEEKIQEEVEEEKTVEIPTKFEIGTQKFEPDLEKIEEIEKEIIKEEPKKEVAKKPKEGFFKKITSKISKVEISEQDFEVYALDLEMLLLENNVALEVAEKMVQDLRERIVGQEFLKNEIEGQIKEAFKDIIHEILVEPFDLIEKIKAKEDKPYTIMFCGINGTGKTTSIAKIANALKEKNISCVLAAADTFRAASIEQIKTHGEKLGIKVIAHDYESDPAAVSFDAIKYAEKNKIDCVLIDTAGRMHTAKNLMAQIEKINRVCKPDTKIYVGESTTGNDAIEQIRSFNFSLNIDGIILSKADIDEKGGTALSVGYVTKKPILYLGTGQKYEKIEPFNKDNFIKKLGLQD